jgi:predicted acetyltransferase
MAVIKNHGSSRFEICEFFVVPYWRRHRIGTELAAMIWKMHPGKWEIKQIQGAGYAVSFWRASVSEFTGNRYTEDVFDDRYWGTVTRQCFENL